MCRGCEVGRPELLGKPGLEFMAPMAIALLGGLVTATFTVLFALPAILIRFGADREPNLSMELA